MRRILLALATTVMALAGVTSIGAQPAGAVGVWSWPVIGPVTRGYDPPLSVYGAGHRGIDIAVPAGSEIHAPAPGTVTFAGKVAGNLFITLDHGGGLSSTYSWVSGLLVRKGDVVAEGDSVGRTGSGHPGDLIPSLHFGVKLNGAYMDPLDYLSSPDVGTMIRLAPL